LESSKPLLKSRKKIFYFNPTGGDWVIPGARAIEAF